MSVLSMVTDPQFQALGPSDQQAALSGIDGDFGKLNSGDFQAAVTGLQKKAIARPDLVAPPKMTTGSPAAQPMQAVAPSGAPANTMQSVPSEATPEGHAAAVAQRTDTSNLGYVGNAVAQTAMGVAKGAGDTVENTVGKLIPGQADANLASTNGWQTTGKAGESIMEFIASDSALKGLSIAEKLGLASKVADIAEKSPAIAKALNIGMNAARVGGVAGVQTLSKGGTPMQAAENAATTGVAGAALETVVPPAMRAIYKWSTPEDVAAAKAVATTARTASEVQQGISDVGSKVAGTEAVAPTASDPYGMRQTAANRIGQYKGAANSLDELSGNKFSDAQQAVSDSSDDFTTKGKQDFRAAQQNLDSIVEQYRPDLEAKGIDVDGMKSDYRAGMAGNKIAAFLDKTTQEAGKGTEALTAQVKPGTGLKEAILDLAQNNKDLLGNAGWTSDHINDAVGFARQMDTPAASKTVYTIGKLLASKYTTIGGGALAGGYHGYQKNGVTGAITGAVEGAALGAGLNYSPKIAWWILSNPIALKMMNEGLESGASTEVMAKAISEEPGFIKTADANFGPGAMNANQPFEAAEPTPRPTEPSVTGDRVTPSDDDIYKDKAGIGSLLPRPQNVYYNTIRAVLNGPKGVSSNLVEDATHEVMGDFSIKRQAGGIGTTDKEIKAYLRQAASNRAATIYRAPDNPMPMYYTDDQLPKSLEGQQIKVRVDDKVDAYGVLESQGTGRPKVQSGVEKLPSDRAYDKESGETTNRPLLPSEENPNQTTSSSLTPPEEEYSGRNPSGLQSYFADRNVPTADKALLKDAMQMQPDVFRKNPFEPSLGLDEGQVNQLADDHNMSVAKVRAKLAKQSSEILARTQNSINAKGMPRFFPEQGGKDSLIFNPEGASYTMPKLAGEENLLEEPLLNAENKPLEYDLRTGKFKVKGTYANLDNEGARYAEKALATDHVFDIPNDVQKAAGQLAVDADTEPVETDIPEMKKYLEQEQQFTEYVHNKDFDSAVRNWLGMSKDEPITEGIYEGIRKRVGINTKNPVNSAGGPNIGRYQATTPLERFLQSTGKPLQRVPQSTGQTGVLSLGNKGESVDVPIIRGTKGMEGVDKFIDDLVASTNTKSAGSTESRAAQAGKGDVVDAQSNLTEPKNSGMLTAYMRTFAKRQGNPFKK